MIEIDLHDKVVIFKQEELSVPATEHPFRVNSGFGATPGLRGTALIGEFISDGEKARMERYQVDRLATEEEIESALAMRAIFNDPESPFYGLVETPERSARNTIFNLNLGES